MGHTIPLMVPPEAPPPACQKSSFVCPHCEVLSRQAWYKLRREPTNESVEHLDLAVCDHCQRYALWVTGSMVWPAGSLAPAPNNDLPTEVRKVYDEASAVSQISPRAATGLLRLAIQLLVNSIEGTTKSNLNSAIGDLVKMGLRPKVQQALDVLRVVGNDAVHPGQIELDNDPALTRSLFELVNIIATSMISEPATVEAMYSTLPEEKRSQVDRRDGAASDS